MNILKEVITILFWFAILVLAMIASAAVMTTMQFPELLIVLNQ